MYCKKCGKDSPGGKGGHRYRDGTVYKITDDDLEIIDRLRGN